MYEWNTVGVTPVNLYLLTDPTRCPNTYNGNIFAMCMMEELYQLM